MLIPSLLSMVTVFTLTLSFMGLRNSHVPLGRPVTVAMMGIAVLAVGINGMFLAATEPMMLAWNMVANVGYALLVFALGGLVYSYHMDGYPMDDRAMLISAAVPFLMLVLTSTDPWTGVYYSSVDVSSFQGYSYLALEPSWGFLLVVAYAIVLLSALLLMMVRSRLRATEVKTDHVAIMSIAAVSASVISLITHSIYEVPAPLLELLVLTILAYPIYAITFRVGINAWGLSFRNVLDISSDMSMVFDRQGDLVFFNEPASVLLENGHLREDLRGMVGASILSSERSTDEFETMLEGRSLIIRSETVPIESPQNESWGTLVTFRDVTENARQRHELRDANERIKLISSISRHDMINSLTVINGLMFILRERAAGDERAMKLVDSMEGAAEVIHRQLVFMNDYEMVGVSEPSWMDLRGVIGSATRYIGSDDVEITIDTEDHEFLADPLVEKVFTNLMHNSLVHGRGLGRIIIDTERDGGDLLIHYKDDGGGIAPQYREGLFEKGVGSNTGLGLFLSKNILEITGMTMTEQGVHGEGVDFVIRVPAGNHRRV